MHAGRDQVCRSFQRLSGLDFSSLEAPFGGEDRPKRAEDRRISVDFEAEIASKELFGLVQHHGSTLQGGHYTAYVNLGPSLEEPLWRLGISLNNLEPLYRIILYCSPFLILNPIHFIKGEQMLTGSSGHSYFAMRIYAKKYIYIIFFLFSFFF